jgi:glycerol-3-phosphate O-acyltransferase
MTTNGNGNTIRTGRAYSGKIRKFAPALFSPAINASKEGKKVFIVPISVAYDFVAEDRYFCNLTKAVTMKKSKNALVSILGKFYYLFLEFHFFYRMYSLGKGNIYIDTGEPILVKANASKNELAQWAQEGASKCYRITMPALVSYAIGRGVNTKNELKKLVERYATELREAKANFHTTLRLEENIELALKDLELRKIISNGKSISVKRPEIITYYANTIAHHFECGVTH